MSTKRRFLKLVNSLIEPLDAAIVRKSNLDNIIHSLSVANNKILDLETALDDLEGKKKLDEILYQPSYSPSVLPKDAATYLQLDNPRLIELVDKYDAMQRFENLTKGAKK